MNYENVYYTTNQAKPKAKVMIDNFSSLELEEQKRKNTLATEKHKRKRKKQTLRIRVSCDTIFWVLFFFALVI